MGRRYNLTVNWRMELKHLMPNEINWKRTSYESRVDAMADDIADFVLDVLATIDVPAAKASPEKWEMVCRFFAGSAKAARVQRGTAGDGGARMAEYLANAFPSNSDGSNDGFFEFMDWLSNPAEFQPILLRAAMEAAAKR